MDVPVQEDCLVYGTLGFVLRVSQIYGVAALKFESVPDGWRIRVSRYADVYGKIVFLVMSVTATASVAWDFTLGPEETFHSTRHAESIMTVLIVGVTSSVLFAEARSAMNRMQNTVSCLAQIRKINAELVQYGAATSFEKLQVYITAWSLVGGHIIPIIECGMLFYEIFTRHADYIMEGLYLAYFVEVVIQKILVLQIFVIHVSVLSSFKHLNDSLNNLLLQIRKEYLINKATKAAPGTVHHLGVLYCRLRDVLRALEESHGYVMVPLTTSFVVHLVITPYNFLSRIFGDTLDFWKALWQIWWIVYHVIDMLIFIEPIHRTLFQVNRTKHLISQFLRVTPPTHRALNVELEIFYQHLSRKKVIYSPMTVYKVNRGLIASILGNIVTYLVVVMQL